MKDIIERVLAPLVGLRLWAPERESDLLVLHLGERREVGGQSVVEYGIRIACAWRIGGPTEILAGSGDLFTPTDPDADLENFDWDPPGASWWDNRLQEIAQLLADPVAVTTFVADSYGGFRLVFTRGIELEVFPNSSPSPHVETEFWRLLRPGQDEDYVVVGTNGIELVQPT
jgi:hypothetical protein